MSLEIMKSMMFVHFQLLLILILNKDTNMYTVQGHVNSANQSVSLSTFLGGPAKVSTALF